MSDDNKKLEDWKNEERLKLIMEHFGFAEYDDVDASKMYLAGNNDEKQSIIKEEQDYDEEEEIDKIKDIEKTSDELVDMHDEEDYDMMQEVLSPLAEKILEKIKESSNKVITVEKGKNSEKALRELTKEGYALYDNYNQDDSKYVVVDSDNEQAMRHYFGTSKSPMAKEQNEPFTKKPPKKKKKKHSDFPNPERDHENSVYDGLDMSGASEGDGGGIEEEDIDERRVRSDADPDRTRAAAHNKRTYDGQPVRESIEERRFRDDIEPQKTKNKQHNRRVREHVERMVREYCSQESCKQSDGDSGSWKLKDHETDETHGCYDSKEDCERSASYGSKNEIKKIVTEVFRRIE